MLTSDGARTCVWSQDLWKMRDNEASCREHIQGLVSPTPRVDLIVLGWQKKQNFWPTQYLSRGFQDWWRSLSVIYLLFSLFPKRNVCWHCLFLVSSLKTGCLCLFILCLQNEKSCTWDHFSCCVSPAVTAWTMSPQIKCCSLNSQGDSTGRQEL